MTTSNKLFEYPSGLEKVVYMLNLWNPDTKTGPSELFGALRTVNSSDQPSKESRTSLKWKIKASSPSFNGKSAIVVYEAGLPSSRASVKHFSKKLGTAGNCSGNARSRDLSARVSHIRRGSLDTSSRSALTSPATCSKSSLLMINNCSCRLKLMTIRLQ